MATRRSSTTTRKSSSNDALAMLMADHKKVQKMFRDFEKKCESDPEEAEQIMTLAIAELKIHTTLEEEMFYPEARQALGAAADLVDEAEIEHGAAKSLIQQIEQMQSNDGHRTAAFKVLGEYVKHHIQEEEKEMFPKLKRAKVDFESMSRQMMERKQQLQSELGVEPEEEAESARGRRGEEATHAR
ncbi:MAG TPA: hemerythrin domain-containing protein [Burkholderiaceae bacterium]|nr:hemerythrin domain-containing protein [Burkholderiaceae bacterium]